MNLEQQVMVHRLEVCLSDIRKIAGWKGVELGNMLGLSRQAISTLEKQHSRLTLAQYVAVRHLLDAWMDRHPENKTLHRIVPLLLDAPPMLEKPYKDLLKATSTIASAAVGSASVEVTDVIAKVILDEWEEKNSGNCYEQLAEELDKGDKPAETKPGNWTDKILEWR